MRLLHKLIFKCFIVTLPLWLLWAYIWIMPTNIYSARNRPLIWNKNFINTHHKNKYDTLIIGDSLANSAFLPNYLSDNTINLAVNTANPFTEYYILDTYLKNNQAPKTCYIMFADHHMQRINGFYPKTLYLHQLTFNQEAEIFLQRWSLGDFHLWR